MIIVETTALIKALFAAEGFDLHYFTGIFKQWKEAGPSGEDDFYEFGKDSFYAVPAVNGMKNVLRHVHLVPILDSNSFAQWNRNWQKRSRRTSDRALVYVEDNNTRFLLIDILPEPMAHHISSMSTPQHLLLMQKFAEIADQYIYHGRIIL